HVFKATLLAPDGADAATGPDPRHAGDLHLVSIAEGDEPGDEEPAELRAAAEALTDAAPLGLPVAELGRRAGLGEEAAAQTALRLCAREYAWPSAAPPRFGYPAPERPLVPALGRIVAARTGQLPTLGWDTMELETRIQAALISPLDGTRDRDELAAALREREEELGIEGMSEEGLRAAVETHLEELAGMGGLAPG
ncbi:MAG TPA: hypothetical protein VKA36_01475, partial [Solirubrobacterales bacterium]|nr:hypothetical protein [Solirubrobacterales bacterium]